MTRQLALSIGQPPRTGPIAPAAAPAAAQIPIARPFAAPENVLPNRARLFGNSIAAPIPWRARPASSVARLGATVQANEANANTEGPATRSPPRPNPSPAR